MLKIAARSVLFITAAFLIVSVIAFSSLKISFLSIAGKNAASSESLLYFMAMESRALHSVLPEMDDVSFTKSTLEFLTHLNVSDIRTFLVSEIPGLQAAMPRQLVAGDDDEFGHLPIESPVPPDFGDWESNEDKEAPVQEKPEPPANPAALIYHTHTRESYLPFKPGVTDINQAFHMEKNVTLFGKRLGEKLEEKGIKTLVNTDDVSDILNQRGMTYSQSYKVSRELVTEALAQNKEVQLVLDIHRDTARKDKTTAMINNISHAKVLFIVGTGHPNYEKNLLFAERLNSLLKAKYPSLSRGVWDKPRDYYNNGIYNQDLAEKSIVIELGGVDNTQDELNRSVDILAEVISEYYWGEAVEANN